MIAKGIIKEGRVDFFGKPLIESTVRLETKTDGEIKLPFQFSFNSGWKFSHRCCNCKSDVYIFEDFESKRKNFKVIPNINSSNFETSLIKTIASYFKNLDAVNVDSIFYLNRTNFDYQFDFQRKSSIHLTYYSCENCNSEYLGVIRIGYPLFAEKNIPFGKLGEVNIEEIVQIEAKKGLLYELQNSTPPS